MQQRSSIYQAVSINKEQFLRFVEFSHEWSENLQPNHPNNPTTLKDFFILKSIIEHIELLEDLKIIQRVRMVHQKEMNNIQNE